jgi:RNA polymerase primary sigma factor
MAMPKGGVCGEATMGGATTGNQQKSCSSFELGTDHVRPVGKVAGELAAHPSTTNPGRRAGDDRSIEPACGRRQYSGRPSAARDDPLLAAYFCDLSRFSLFTPAEEAAAAHRIQQLEVEEWVALFSHPPVLPHLLGHLRAVLDGRMPRGSRGLLTFARRYREHGGRLVIRERRTLAALGWEMGWKLHDLDCDRRVLNGAVGFVRALPAAEDLDSEGRRVARTARFRRYLAAVASAGCTTVRAKEQFVLANLRLVIAVARHYQGGSTPLIDLIQEGNIGLMKAVGRYDVRKGYRFSTYASWWIRHMVNRALSEKSRLVRIPVYLEERQRHAERAATALSTASGREPTDEEIAAEIGVPATDVRRRTSLDYVVSLDQYVGDDEGRRRVDLVPDENAPDPEEHVGQEQQRSELRKVLDFLPAVEASVLRMHYGLGGGDELTLREIGDGRGRSRERIRQIEVAAFQRVRKRLRVSQ